MYLVFGLICGWDVFLLPCLFWSVKPSCANISDNSFCISGSWEWRINFREGLIDEEDGERVENVVTYLGGSKPTVGVTDSYFWWKNSTSFSIKVAYDMILEESLTGPSLGG